MYTIRTDDHHPPVVLATADTLDAAITAVAYLAAITGRQLAANSEGVSEFWLRLAAESSQPGEDPYYLATTGTALLTHHRGAAPR